MPRLTITLLSVAASMLVSACAMPQDRNPSTAAGAARIDRYCVMHTGSRLMVEDDRADKTRTFRDGCIDAGGRVYTREQIESTGEIDLAAALRKLDPSIY